MLTPTYMASIVHHEERVIIGDEQHHAKKYFSEKASNRRLTTRTRGGAQLWIHRVLGLIGAPPPGILVLAHS